MHHIRLDDHGFTELCKSLRAGEAVLLIGHDLERGATRIEVSKEVMAGMVIVGEPARAPAPKLAEKAS